MSEDKWKIQRHVVPAAHMRGFARGSADEFSQQQIRLAIKQFSPISNPEPARVDVTLIMSGGLSVVKESFEPYFDALLDASETSGSFRIRSIWIADPWNVGESYGLNEGLVGDDPNWIDHTRDLYNIINRFSDQMPQPLFGMGESWGAGHFTLLSAWHPRLFAGIILLEPAMGPGLPMQNWPEEGRFLTFPAKPKYWPGSMASRRPDRWKTREDGVKHLSRSPFYAQMDPKVRQLALKYDLKDVTDGTDSYVTLSTPKSVEAQYWGRPEEPLAPGPSYPIHEQPHDWAKHVPTFYQPYAMMFYDALGKVPCPALFLWGDKSFVSAPLPEYRKGFMRCTGTEVGGGGGVEKGQVTSISIEKAFHAITLTHPTESGQAVAPWVGKIAKAYMEDYDRRRTARPFGTTLSKEWMDRIRALDNLPAPPHVVAAFKL